MSDVISLSSSILDWRHNAWLLANDCQTDMRRLLIQAKIRGLDGVNFFRSCFAGGVSGAAEDKLVCFTIDWAARKITERQRLSIAKPGIDMIALRPDQRIFATGGWDGRVRVFHFAKCKPLTVLKVSCCQCFYL